MYFCPKCGYLFEIAKNIDNKQSGGKLTKLDVIFEKVLDNKSLTEDDIKDITKTELESDSRYDSMNMKNQKKLQSKIRALDKNFFKIEESIINTKKSYHVCRNCDNVEEIKPSTLIYSKSYTFYNSIIEEDYSYLIHDNTLPRTRNYICPNKKCKTHKNENLNEAIITKNENKRVIYICTICLTSFIY